MLSRKLSSHARARPERRASLLGSISHVIRPFLDNGQRACDAALLAHLLVQSAVLSQSVLGVLVTLAYGHTLIEA